ncbi:hypothetical protein GYMLUDRAFT_683648 [Collybiopsis luxurians FD-317 M1]|uniref:Uncharacterized protein n=1 Tax=Collybiopsis luxurians FD-317 M1 TaxID=944289 RepID=A0A0D0B6S6_9AGAR|nr:hypothetical protein GYMLUDRAFT_683648 [Collybiopsis luxurians FD-317 M1]
MQKSRPGATASDLQLATTIFECTKCSSSGTLMYYPQMFYHECCFEDDGINSARLMESRYNLTSSSWSAKSLVLSESSSRVAKAIVQACSLDPATTSIRDLDIANPLIECETCKDASRSGLYSGRLFMRWLSAINDTRHHHTHTLSINNFEGERQQILACEPAGNIFGRLRCVYCHKKQFNYVVNLLNHLRFNHSNILRWDPDECTFPLSLAELWTHCYRDPTVKMAFGQQVFRYKPM